jgi:hypothetical protein
MTTVLAAGKGSVYMPFDGGKEIEEAMFQGLFFEVYGQLFSFQLYGVEG